MSHIVIVSLLAAAMCIFAHGWWRARQAVRHWRSETDRQINIGAAQYTRLCAANLQTTIAQGDANELANCVRAYITQMDSYSMKLGEQPCALSRERSALQLHDSLSKCQNSLPSSTVSSSALPPTPTPPSPTSAES